MPPEGISNTKLFIDQYNWKKTDFTSHKKDWKKHEKNNNTIALNILHVPYNIKGIRHACKSKYNSMLKYQVTVLMIADCKKWHYFVLKRLSELLRGVTSKHVRDFYCLNCFHSYSTEDKLKKHYEVCKNHDYCYAEMLNGDNRILKYNYEEVYEVSIYYLG